jgi:hypothetical protein
LKKEEKIKMIFFKILITGNKITFFQTKNKKIKNFEKKQIYPRKYNFTNILFFT